MMSTFAIAPQRTPRTQCGRHALAPRARRRRRASMCVERPVPSVLNDVDRERVDDRPDSLFYSHARFYDAHDPSYRSHLNALYERYMDSGNAVLDLMSAHSSYIPAHIQLGHLEGVGLNEAELMRNPALTSYLVWDLNERSERLPFADAVFDAVLNNSGVGYLQRPEVVIADVFRLLKPGGAILVSFSDALYWEKAIAAWRFSDNDGRTELVARLLATAGFEIVERKMELTPRVNVITHRQLRALGEDAKKDPFFAVVGRKPR